MIWLAEAATDTAISGNWLIAVIGAIASGAALIIGRMQGTRKARTTTIESPVPEVPTRKVSTPPSWDAHRALCDRVSRNEEAIAEVRRDMADVRREVVDNYKEILQAGADRERSLSDKLDGIARGIHARIDTIIKPTRRA